MKNEDISLSIYEHISETTVKKKYLSLLAIIIIRW